VALVLDRTERRVIGALLEKQLAVPEAYPLTLNSLVLACNQKSNRDPETAFTEGEVQGALHALMDRGWVTRIELAGARTVRFEHRVVEQLGVDEADAALLAELLLRGPQSVPELRSRASRMRAFSSLEEVEQRLAELASRPVPYVRLLGKRPGERVARWEHLLSRPGESAPVESHAPAARPSARTPPSVPPSSLEDRVAALEREVASLRLRLDSIE
jgi:uncharacterized protein